MLHVKTRFIRRPKTAKPTSGQSLPPYGRRKAASWEACRKYKSLEDYRSSDDLLDFLREDIAEMQGFFSWLDFTTLNIERIISACTYYFIYMKDEKTDEKLRLMKDVSDLIAFNFSLTGYQDMIRRNAYYYEDMLDKVDCLRQQHVPAAE